MGSGATHLAFAAALACFVVSVAGLVTVRRPGLVGPANEVRVLAAVAFGVVGAASVVWGAVVAPGEPTPLLALARMVGLAAAIASVGRWLVPAWPRATVGIGLAVMLAGDAAALAERPTLGAAISLAGAGVACVGLGRVSARSVTTAVPVLGAVLGVGVVLVVASATAGQLQGSLTQHRDLGRLLFLVGAASVAVVGVAASLVADRLARDLDLLTEAAAQVQAGVADARVRIRSGDELGLLGDAFTSMASSVRAVSSELQVTVADETALRQRLQAVIDGMSEAVLAVDPGGLVSEANPAACGLLATERADLVGRPVAEVVRWRLADGRSTPLAADDLVAGKAMAVDLAVGDTTVAVVATAGALRPAPRPSGEGSQPGLDPLGAVGTVLLLRDVRGEREVDDLKAAILSNIGHELRTPLTPIKGYAAMLRDRELDEVRAQRFAAEIAAGVDQLEQVVDQLVTFATVAAGRLTLDPEPVTARDMAAGLRARWGPRLGPQHPFTVEVRAADHTGTATGSASVSTSAGTSPEAEHGPAGLAVDRSLFERALDELVANAVKFSPGGGPVRVTMTAAGGGIEVLVVDEGVGMTAEVLGALGDDFAQADPSATRAFDGLGLGIAFADRIIRAHGGRLRIASAPGQGTSVRVELTGASPADPGVSTP